MKQLQSAGLLLYRNQKKHLELFLVHPGGPFFKNKDAGAWSIPKGEFDHEGPSDEFGMTALAAAKRELKEETGFSLDGHFIELMPVKQKGGKMVYAWAIEADRSLAGLGMTGEIKIKSNEFEMEWPPKSGKMQRFPEVDKAGWFTVEEAKEKINPAQFALIDDLLSKLKI